MISLSLQKILNTKSSELYSIILNWKDYTEESVLLSYLDSKRRQLSVNDDVEKSFTEFINNSQTSLDNMVSAFCQKNNVNSYLEFYTQKMNLSETAAGIVNKELKAQYYQNQYQINKSNAAKDLLIGGAIFLVGGTVSFISMSSGKGGIIAYGAVAYGAIRMGSGLMKYFGD